MSDQDQYQEPPQKSLPQRGFDAYNTINNIAKFVKTARVALAAAQAAAPVVPIVGVGIGVGLGIFVLVYAALQIIPGMIGDMTEDVSISKTVVYGGSDQTASLRKRDRVLLTNEEWANLNDKTFTYTITINAVNTITIGSVSDSLTILGKEDQFNDTLVVGSDKLPNLEGVTIDKGEQYVFSYNITFDQDYVDTLIRNNLTMTYTKDGVSGVIGESSAIMIGDAPVMGGGCWPTSGTITQLPYSTTRGSGGQVWTTHLNTDSYDISTTAGSSISSPAKGTVLVRPETDPRNTISGSGNLLVVQSVYGDLLFMHLQSYSVRDGQSVEVGEVLGTVGSTGNSSGPHLHYEYRTTWISPNSCAPSCAGSTSYLSSLVGPDAKGEAVTRTGQVVEMGCGQTMTTETSNSLDDVGCFSFSDNGGKPWTQEEKDKVKRTLEQKIVSNQKINQLVCSGGGVTLQRINGSCRNKGGAWAGYTQGDTISFCDNLFSGEFGGFESGTYGLFSVVHEIAHILTLRHGNIWPLVDNYDFFSLTNSSSFVGTTYPYDLWKDEDRPSGPSAGTIKSENFAEAFSYCQTTSDHPFRNKTSAPTNEAIQCQAVDVILNQL